MISAGARVGGSPALHPGILGPRSVPHPWKRDACGAEATDDDGPPSRPSQKVFPNCRLAAIVRRRLPVRSPGMEVGYARVSTVKQDLERQIEALQAAGIARERIYVDKKSGATVERPGLRAALEYARAGDVIVVHTLDRLGRTVRDTLNLIHDLGERGVGVRNLADPIKIDSSDRDDPMAQLAVVLLALFAQMERTYAIERAAHAPRSRRSRAAASAGRSWSTPASSATRRACARRGARSRKSSRRR